MSDHRTDTRGMLTQLTIKDGRKAHGSKGEEAILKELKQIHTHETLMLMNSVDRSYDKRKKGHARPNVLK